MKKPPTTDPAHDVLKYERHPLDAFFRPEMVAVVGATEEVGSGGCALMWNLMSNPFGGTVFPVNPKRANVSGIKAYPSIAKVPDRVNLALVATPAPTVPDVLAECGVEGTIIIPVGFKDIGRAEGLRRITAIILFDNRPVQRLLRKLGFRLRREREEGVVKVGLDLYQTV
ncbi:MAG TPA: CoA-binding protein [Rubrobacteraceae bacterium]|nr:CoA-binding protein [Rubrobacteraceae bacterium]